MPFTMGLDIGTTTIKAIVFDTDQGIIASSAKSPTPLSHPNPGWSQHDPEILWQTIADLIGQAGSGYTIDAISISSFAEAGLPLDDKMQPLYPIIAWYDTRSALQLNELLNQITEEEIFSITGQKPGYSFALLKVLWLRANLPSILNRLAKWVSVPDYIHFQLCGSLATDYTQASRTLFFDQTTKEWSERMVVLAGLSAEMLPQALCSGSVVGTVSKTAAYRTGLSENTLCVLGGHDHLCGAYASGGLSNNELIDSMGTSQALIMITDHFLPATELLREGYVQYPYVIPDTCLIKGGLKAAGKALTWGKDIFQASSQGLGTAMLDTYSRNLPYWLPFFQGSGTPGREPDARATLLGLDANHSGEEIFLALLEGFAFWLRSNYEHMIQISGANPKQIIAIGGANQNEILQKLKASALGLPLTVPSIPEASAVGAALLAAVGCGIVNDYRDAPELNKYPSHIVHPDPAIGEILTERYNSCYLLVRELLGSSNK
jgi:xylulokinase